MPLKVLVQPLSNSIEKEECFLEHLRSHAIESAPLTVLDPKIILKALQNSTKAIAVMSADLRFLISPEKFTNLACDMALFTNHRTPIGRKEHVDTSFLFFKPTEKTFNFLEAWAENKKEPDLALDELVQKKALSMQILHLPTTLKIENLNEAGAFHRWLLKV